MRRCSLIRTLAVPVALLVVSGCAHYTPYPLTPADSRAALASRTLSDPALARFIRTQDSTMASAPKRWDLRTLTWAALYFNPQLDVARAGLRVSRAAVITAGGRPEPAVSLGAEDVTHTENPSPWILGFIFDIPIETAGKRGLRIAAARSLSTASSLMLGTEAWKVRERVRSALLRVWAASRGVDLARREVRLREARLRLLEGRLEAGAVSALKVARARSASQEARLRAEDRAGRLSSARVDLAEAVGIPTHALDSVSLDLEVFEARDWPSIRDEPELRRSALLDRTDVQARMAEFRAADAAFRLELAKQYPDLHLGPGFTWEQGERHFVLAPSLLLPILTRNRGPIAEASARRAAAAARFTALQARVLAQLDRAHAAYRSARRYLAVGDSLKRTRHALAARVERAVQVGEDDPIEAVDARLQEVAAEEVLLRARTSAIDALGELEDTFQHPLLGDLAELPVSARDLRERMR